MSALIDDSATTAAREKKVRLSAGDSFARVFGRRTAIVVLFLLAWQAYVTFADVPPQVLPGPVRVFQALGVGITDGTIPSATLATIQVLLISMVIGSLIAGVLVTLALWSKIGEDIFVLLRSAMNPLPAIAILPLAIVWFGLSMTSLVFVVVFTVIWPVAMNVYMGFKTTNPTIINVGRNIGLNGWKEIWYVLLPSTLPFLLAGLRTAWAFGWRTVVAAELVFGVAGGAAGLGSVINESRYFLKLDMVFAALVVIAALGIAFEWVFSFIEKKTVVRWGVKAAS